MKRNIALLIEQSVNVIDLLNTGLRLTIEEQNFLCEHFEQINLKKNEFTIKEGEFEKYLYFIEDGILRYWSPNLKEGETTFWFSFSGEFANSYLSMKNKYPSEFNIQALRNTLVWRISLQNLFYLYTHSLNINKIARIVLENIYIRKIEREIYLLKLSPKEIYKKLIEKEKDIICSIPSKYIASYIGVTAQTLSKIRKHIYRK